MSLKSALRHFLRRSESGAERAIVLGLSPLAKQLIRVVSESKKSSYEIIGVISESLPSPVVDDLFGCPLLGAVGCLEEIVYAHSPDYIIVAKNDGGCEISERLLLLSIGTDLTIIQAVEAYEELTGKVPIDVLTPGNFLFDHEVRLRSLHVYANRLISVLIAASGLVVLAPLVLLIAISVKFDSAGPAFFVQNRSGRGGARFGLYKFRTMRADIAEYSVWAGENVHRITRVGKWLRKFRLDELPQLINVLKGDMNIVGPRPHPSPSSELVDLISRNISECGYAVPYYSMRSKVRPGITGWAQVRYKYANGLCEELEKLCYDLYYVKHYSVWIDLRILLMTAGVILRGTGHGEIEQENGSEEGVKKTNPASTGPSNVSRTMDKIVQPAKASVEKGLPVVVETRRRSRAER